MDSIAQGPIVPIDNIRVPEQEEHSLTAPADRLQPSPRTALAETTLDIDLMYNIIGKTISALDNISVDGCTSEGSIETILQAHANKSLLPDTEIDMLHSRALPMSEEDVKAFIEKQKLLTSIGHRKSQLQMPTKKLSEITGSRLRVAYRLARYMTHIRGTRGGGIGIPLLMSMAMLNAQINKFEMPTPYDPTVGWYRGLAAIRNLLAQANEGGYEYSYLISGEYFIAKGMSILPPPIHDGYFPQGDKPLWEYRRKQYTPKNYRADTDGPLAIYLNICELLVRHLGIGEGADVDEQAAVTALLNPTIARIAWPCRDEIETFEEYILMPYIGRIMVEKSQDATIDRLKEDMGLTHAEGLDFVEMYKTYALNINVFDPEKERSILLGRLDKLADVCQEGMQVTTQQKTIMGQALLLGLTKHNLDDNVDRRQSLENALEAEIVEQSDDKKESQAKFERPVKPKQVDIIK